jgi:hypothetical protein
VLESPIPDDVAILLDAYDKRGGVLVYEFYDRDGNDGVLEAHREAARLFLDSCAAVNRKFIESINASNPLARTLSYQWEETKLTGGAIDFPTFWGIDDVEQKPIAPHAWIIPNIDGYKLAFFHPPYGLSGGVLGNLHLFESINAHVLGDGDRNQLVIWSWSTNCSSFFDEGHEWWGAFLWTITAPDNRRVAVIAASATD